MKKTVITASILTVSLALSVVARQPTMVQPDGTLKWEAAPPALPKGAQAIVLVGNPTKEGPYVLRVKLPAGYKVAPHSHTNDENVTVISSMFHAGVGETFDESKGQAIKPGGYVHFPKGVKHFAWASQETVIQLHGIGPADFVYVNPADDPRKK